MQGSFHIILFTLSIRAWARISLNKMRVSGLLLRFQVAGLFNIIIQQLQTEGSSFSSIFLLIPIKVAGDHVHDSASFTL